MSVIRKFILKKTLIYCRNIWEGEKNENDVDKSLRQTLLNFAWTVLYIDEKKTKTKKLTKKLKCAIFHVNVIGSDCFFFRVGILKIREFYFTTHFCGYVCNTAF